MPSTPQRSDRSTDALVTLLPPRVDALPPARQQFVAWLHAIDLIESAVDDLEVVFSELTSNAVDASPGHSAAVRVQAYLEHGDVVLEVSNRTDGLTSPRPAAGPSGLDGSGRGLTIARAFVDELELIQETPDRVTVRCRRRIGDRS